MKYNNAILYYFSGTGNARRAALWAEDIIQAEKIPVDLREVGKINPPQATIDHDTNTLIGFFFPSHGFTAIWAMLKFILMFPIARGEVSVFAAATRGGLKFGRFYIPGYEGNGLLTTLLILRLKKYRVVGSIPLDMPSNWAAVHPSLPQQSCFSILERAKEKVNQFITHLLDGCRCIYGWKTLPIAIASIPISLGYLLVGRFFIAKTMIADSKCNGCGLCKRICPVEAIHFTGNRPYWTFGCENCQRCINFCPKSAIQSSLSLGILFYLLLCGKIFEWLRVYLNFRLSFMNYIAYYIYYFATLYICYKIIHSASKWKPINLFIEYTSLTRYFRRYREPDTKSTDFQNYDKE